MPTPVPSQVQDNVAGAANEAADVGAPAQVHIPLPAPEPKWLFLQDARSEGKSNF